MRPSFQVWSLDFGSRSGLSYSSAGRALGELVQRPASLRTPDPLLPQWPGWASQYCHLVVASGRAACSSPEAGGVCPFPGQAAKASSMPTAPSSVSWWPQVTGLRAVVRDNTLGHRYFPFSSVDINLHLMLVLNGDFSHHRMFFKHDNLHGATKTWTPVTQQIPTKRLQDRRWAHAHRR